MKPYHNIKNYQNVLKKTDLEFLIGKLKKESVLNKNFVGIPNLWVNCFIKKTDRPFRKFLNSIKTLPPLILVNQHSSLPLPLPIRTPLGFLVKGKWGNAVNHTNLRVYSDFRFVRFKNNLNLNNWLAVKWIGFKIIIPELP